MKQGIIFVITSLIGLGVWVGISIISGKEEAWDSPLFFVLGLPIMILASGIAGYIDPGGFWLWGIAVVILQPVALLINSEIGPFILVGFFTFGVFAVLCVFGAWVGGKLRGITKKT